VAIAAVAAAGLLIIAQAAKRRPKLAGLGLVLWIWLAGVAALLSGGGVMTASGGIFLTSVVAAGLLFGARAAVAATVATAFVSGAIVGAGALGRIGSVEPTPTAWGLWFTAMVILFATPVLLSEAVGRLRRALETAEEAERRYRLVTESASDVIWLIEDGRLRYISPSCERLYGWSPSEMLELQPVHYAAFTPDSAQVVRATLEEAIESGADHVRYEGELFRREGGTVWLEVDLAIRRDAEGRVSSLVGVGRDISERRRLEAERERIRSELVQAQKLEIVGQLSAGVAHDLNNRLTVILGAAEALADEQLGARIDAQKEITDAALGAAALTRQFQMFGRRRASSPVVCDLNAIVARMERTLRRVLDATIELITAPAASPALVLVDEAELEQVLLNLAVNARDAMPAGGRLTVEVVPGSGERPNAWLLRVADTGTGIDPATSPHVFEPFFTTKPEGRGTGLGLAMVRRIVEDAGGSVRFETALGQGTTFEVELPRQRGPVHVERAAPGAPIPPSLGATILVVDDDTEVRRLLRRVLSAHGYRVLDAASPAHALTLLSAGDPLDLLVTDIVMPGMRGPELSSALRRTRPGLPVLYVSGYESETLERGEGAGSVVLHKPFAMRTFLLAVGQALRPPPRRGDGGGALASAS
jgi:PAS domain S-box-containing protein